MARSTQTWNQFALTRRKAQPLNGNRFKFSCAIKPALVLQMTVVSANSTTYTWYCESSPSADHCQDIG